MAVILNGLVGACETLRSGTMPCLLIISVIPRLGIICWITIYTIQYSFSLAYRLLINQIGSELKVFLQTIECNRLIFQFCGSPSAMYILMPACARFLLPWQLVYTLSFQTTASMLPEFLLSLGQIINLVLEKICLHLKAVPSHGPRPPSCAK